MVFPYKHQDWGYKRFDRRRYCVTSIRYFLLFFFQYVKRYITSVLKNTVNYTFATNHRYIFT